ncbi:hypothetical protein D9M71_716090 [compost metagenome]
MLAGALVKISRPSLNRVLESIYSACVAVDESAWSSSTNNFIVAMNEGSAFSFAVASVASILAKSSATFSFISICGFLDVNARKSSTILVDLYWPAPLLRSFSSILKTSMFGTCFSISIRTCLYIVSSCRFMSHGTCPVFKTSIR